MNVRKKTVQRSFSGLVIIILLLAVASPVQAQSDGAQVEPASVDVFLLPGDSTDVEKTVYTPEYPPKLDLLLLEDETGSFSDDIEVMQGTPPDYTDGKASDIWDGVAAEVVDFRGGVAGFRDFSQSTWGDPGDWVYRLTSDLSSSKADWLAGIGALSAGGGYDGPEAQLAALKSAADGVPWDSNGDGDLDDPEDTPADQNPAWREDGVTRVVMLVTDANYHEEGDDPAPYWPGPDYDETIAELNAANIHVIVLTTAPVASFYNDLADDTGGSVQLISSDSSDIVTATLNALEEVKTDVWANISNSNPEISISITPLVEYDVAGGTPLSFTETITVDPCAPAGDYYATVSFYANTYGENEGTLLLPIEEVNVTVLPIPVSVDIKPGSCPNAFNTGQKGTIPVAITGTADFDVMTIDPSTVCLNGVPALRWSYDDVTTPYSGQDECGCWEEGADGYTDLVLHFDSEAFSATLSGYTVKGDPIPVLVTGSNTCGASIEGTDCVWIVK